MKKRADGREVEYPVQDDHFVLTDAPEIAAAYGDEPRELDVVLPFPDIARNFDGWYQVWAGGVLCCKGDGELVDYASPFSIEQAKLRNGKMRTKVHRADGDTLVSGGVATQAFAWNGQSFQEGDHVPCPGGAGGLYPHCAVCQKSAILKVMMADPDLIRLGYYQLATGSGRNYDTINGMLEWVRGEMINIGAGDTVKCVRYHLRMVEEQTTYQDDAGVRKPTKRWFLHIEPFREDLAAIYARLRRQALQAPEPPPALTAGDDEPIDVSEYTVIEEPAPPPFAEEGGNGNGPDWDDDLTEENSDEPEPEPAPVQQAPATFPPELQAAMDYHTKKGERLGTIPLTKLSEMLDSINAAADPSAYAEAKGHLETLIEWMTGEREAAQEALPL